MTSLIPSLRLALINKAKSKKNNSQKGFTLVELLVTVGIIGTLSAIAVPTYLEYSKEGKLKSSDSAALQLAKDCVNTEAAGGAVCTETTFTDPDVDNKVVNPAVATIVDGEIVLTPANNDEE